MKKQIILIGISPPPYNGMSIAFQTLVDALHQKKYSIKIINLSDKKNSLLKIIDYLYYLFLLVYYASSRNKILYIQLSQSTKGFVRDLFVIIWAYLFKNPVIAHLHGGNYDGFVNNQPPIFRRIILSIWRKIDTFIVLSPELKQMLAFDEEFMRKTTVVPNGLAWTLQNPIVPKTIPSDHVINILYLSNLFESKGYFDVLKAVKILRDEYGLMVKCDFCGHFTTYSDDTIKHSIAEKEFQFNQFCIDNSLTECVQFRGVQNGEAKESFLKNAHFFVLPTNYINEGQPISIIEAMAYGCVCISTPYRAIPSLIKDGKTGFLVEYAHPEQIAQRIYELSLNPTLFYQMSSNAINHFQENYTREKHLEKMVSLFEKYR